MPASARLLSAEGTFGRGIARRPGTVGAAPGGAPGRVLPGAAPGNRIPDAATGRVGVLGLGAEGERPRLACVALQFTTTGREPLTGAREAGDEAESLVTDKGATTGVGEEFVRAGERALRDIMSFSSGCGCSRVGVVAADEAGSCSRSSRSVAADDDGA